MEMGRRGKKKRLVIRAFALCLSLAMGLFPSAQAKAAGGRLTVAAARSLALSESSAYKKQQNQLTLARVKYVQSVKAIRLKEKNQRTFRWTPLFSFKFPENPTESQQYEYTYKPLELQSQIDALEHQTGDLKYEAYKNASTLFVDIYVLQEKIAFAQEQIARCEETLKKNRARLALGQANPSDIDSMEKKLETLRSGLAANQRSFETKKRKLSDTIGMDVTVSYEFVNPFVGADLDRKKLEELLAYTLENDHTYYQARVDEANGLLSLNTNYNLMRKKYGSNMNLVDSFINQARTGQKLDTAAFKLRYDALLDAVDRPWQGKYRFLFIKIPKEWFKGATSGVRYVEDEPYILYEAAVEYQGLKKDREMAEKELTEKVNDSYDNYISARHVCEDLDKDIKKKKDELKKAEILNAAGRMSYEEYAAVQEEYEALQTDRLDAQAAYSTILYEFDRLTCGALEKYMTGALASMSVSGGGTSYVVKDQGEGVYYYIHSLVSDNLFEFGLAVPEDFEVSLTEYELWINGIRVGARTAIDKTIRHLGLDIDQVEKAFVRLYDGENFVDDCAIDPSVYSDKLILTTGYRIEKEDGTEAASYTVSTDQGMGMTTLTITPLPEEKIAYYNIKTASGDYLVDERKRSVKDSFRYLAAMESGLEELTVCFYDQSQQLLYEAEFHTADLTIHKKQ